MKWKKLGVIVAPNKDIFWMASHVGPSFAEVRGNKVILYLTGRDMNNVSRIGVAEMSLEGEKWSIDHIEKEVRYDVGVIGTFDESGVSYPWILRHNGLMYMYYAGWVNGGLSRFQNYTGLATSKDEGKTWQRVKQIPVLDRTESEPFGCGSCSVFIEDGVWKIYYTAFEPWSFIPGKNRPCYNLKYAYSKDGINWIRERKVVIDFKNEDEYVIGKPMILKENGIYKLWYSYRGDQYRLGYAESRDGLNYTRKDEEVGITVSENGFDDQMLEYNYVFDHKGSRYMIYNGNDFGKTGLGLAILEK